MNKWKNTSVKMCNYTSSAGRAGILIFALVKYAIFSLNDCTCSGTFWLCSRSRHTSLEAFLINFSALKPCFCSSFDCSACFSACFKSFWKRSSSSTHRGRSASPLPFISSSFCLRSRKAWSSSLRRFCLVRDAWRSSSKSREVRMGHSSAALRMIGWQTGRLTLTLRRSIAFLTKRDFLASVELSLSLRFNLQMYWFRSPGEKVWERTIMLFLTKGRCLELQLALSLGRTGVFSLSDSSVLVSLSTYEKEFNVEDLL